MLVIALLAGGYFIFGNRFVQAQPWQWADDGLYFRQAQSIEQLFEGNSTSPWLGDYGPHVLSKAPFYPFVMAVSNRVGVPLRLFEYLFLCTAALLVPMALRIRWNRHPAFFIGCVILNLFNPYLPTHPQVHRNNFCSSLILVCLAAIIAIILRTSKGCRLPRRWLYLEALAVGCAMVTREECVWILGPVLVQFVYLLFKCGVRKSWPDLAGFSMIAFLPTLCISLLNSHSYGFYGTSMRAEKEYMRCYKQLARVASYELPPFVVIDTATRKELYKLSPVFDELQPFLEGKLGDEFARNADHLWINQFDITEREFFASNFEFAIQRSLYAAGYRSPDDMRKYIMRLNHDLSRLYKTGQLNPRGVSIGIGSRIEKRDIPVFFSGLGSSLLSNVLFRQARLPQGLSSTGNSSAINEMLSFCGAKAVEGDSYRAIERSIYSIYTSILRLSVPVILALGIVVFIVDVAFFQYRPIHMAILIVFLALCAFTFVMAVVNTWAFAHLACPVSYNALGSSTVLILTTMTVFYLAQSATTLVRLRTLHHSH